MKSSFDFLTGCALKYKVMKERRNSLGASRREGILIQKTAIDALVLSGRQESHPKRRGSLHIGHEWKHVRQSICKGIA